MPAKPSALPPTIAYLKAQGLKGVCPFCRSCGQSGGVAFEALGLPDSTPFPLIARATRFRCLACGARDYAVMPDSRGYRALGMGQICRSMPVRFRYPLTTYSDAVAILPAAETRHVERSPSRVTIVRKRRKAAANSPRFGEPTSFHVLPQRMANVHLAAARRQCRLSLCRGLIWRFSFDAEGCRG